MPENNNFENEIMKEDSCKASQELPEPQKEEVFLEKPPRFAANFYFNPPLTGKMKEKKEVKTSARTVGLGFLFMEAVVFILNITVLLLSEALNAFGVINFNLLEDSAVLQAVQILISIPGFTLPFLLSFKIARIRISDLIEFGAPDKKTVLPFLLFGIAFCSFANMASSVVGGIFESFGIGYNVDFPESPKGIFGFFLTFISTVITPALVEEFACRGLILGHLKKYGEGFAIIVSALLFGLMHGNFEQIPFAFLVGLVLGYITVKSGSIWPAVAVHAFNNFVSVAFEYFLSAFSVDIQNVLYSFFLILCLLSGIIAILLLKNKSEAYKLSPADTEGSEKEKYKWFFTSPVVIIFVCICLAESLAFFII